MKHLVKTAGLLLSLAILFSGSTARGQKVSGNISGLVTDPALNPGHRPHHPGGQEHLRWAIRATRSWPGFLTTRLEGRGFSPTLPATP
jgi:hypothetical protein